MNINNIKEIKHFDKLYADWWDSNGPLKTLHAINPIRLNYIKKIVPVKNKVCLDIGCGGGILSYALAKNKAKVLGIDPSKKLIDIALKKSHLYKKNIHFLNITLEEYVKEVNNKFDVIFCMELIEHVKNPSDFIKTLKPLMKKNSLVFFSTINRNFYSYLKTIFFAEYVFNIIPKGTHLLKNFVKPSELNNMMEKINCDLINFQGFNYNPITNKADFSKSINCNYLACFTHK